jgi:hypothetical protein
MSYIEMQPPCRFSLSYPFLSIEIHLATTDESLFWYMHMLVDICFRLGKFEKLKDILLALIFQALLRWADKFTGNPRTMYSREQASQAETQPTATQGFPRISSTLTNASKGGTPASIAVRIVFLWYCRLSQYSDCT